MSVSGSEFDAARSELRCAVFRCDQVGDGETRACVDRVTEPEEGLFFVGDSSARLLVMGAHESCLDGRVVVMGSVTNVPPFFVASGVRCLQTVKHSVDVEGWIVARSERRNIDGLFWIKLRCKERFPDEQRSTKRSKVEVDEDSDDLFDIYDAEYGYQQELEDQDESVALVDLVVELSDASSWGWCVPGCQVGLWGVQKSFASGDVQLTAKGAVILNAEPSLEIMEECFCYSGQITSIVHAGQLTLDNDLMCLLSKPRHDLIAGMFVQIWHAHPVWDGPALVMCPFSTLVVTGYEPILSQQQLQHHQQRQQQEKQPLPSFCAALPVWARVWLSMCKVPVDKKHTARALLFSLGSRQPATVELNVTHFRTHSSLICPLYDCDARVPEAPVVLPELMTQPHSVAPFPFAYCGRGPLVMMQNVEETVAISLEKSIAPRRLANNPWLLCTMSSEFEAILQNVETNEFVLLASVNRFAFVPRHFYCSETLLPASAFNLQPDVLALLEAQCNLLLGALEIPFCVCDFVVGQSGSVFGLSVGNNSIVCAANKQHPPMVLSSNAGLPRGNLVIRNLSKNGKLTLFSQIQSVSSLPPCSQSSVPVAMEGIRRGRVVRIGDSSCMVDDGSVSVKLLNYASAKFGEVINFRISSVASSTVRGYRTAASTILTVLEAIRRGKKPPPCPTTQYLGQHIQ